MNVQVQPQARTRQHLLRVGSVSYLNAKPLIYGLDGSDGVDLQLDVPSRLLDGLQSGRFDVALLPVIDYQRMDGLVLVPVGGIGSEDETLTVRIFSRRPIERIEGLACDTDSHTSVALARVILAEAYGIRPEFMDLKADRDARESLLLIGDKVVCDAPAGFDFQLDLGAAWKRLTGLPFLFACWTARRGADLGDLPDRLERAKRDGLANVEAIIRRDGVSRGWPPDVARQYLTKNLQFDVGERQLEAVRRFHGLAAKHGMIAGVRDLDVYR
jgi:chorismate dehydratase